MIKGIARRKKEATNSHFHSTQLCVTKRLEPGVTGSLWPWQDKVSVDRSYIEVVDPVGYASSGGVGRPYPCVDSAQYRSESNLDRVKEQRGLVLYGAISATFSR